MEPPPPEENPPQTNGMLYVDIDRLVTTLAWSEQDLADLDPDTPFRAPQQVRSGGSLSQAQMQAAISSAQLNVQQPTLPQSFAAAAGQAAQMQSQMQSQNQSIAPSPRGSGGTHVLASQVAAATAHMLDHARDSAGAAMTTPHGSAFPSAHPSAPQSRRRSVDMEAEDAHVAQSLEQLHMFGVLAHQQAGQQHQLVAAAQHARQQLAVPHLADANRGSASQRALPGRSSSPSSGRTPSDSSDRQQQQPVAAASEAGAFCWERCEIEGNCVRRVEDAEPAFSPATLSIGDISMVRPFEQSQSMLHYWFRTWKVPRITVSVSNARTGGAGCTVSLEAITVSSPSDAMTKVEVRGTTSAPLVGGQATFSGLMFGSTSYSFSNALFHLLVKVERNGEVLDARISTGIHVFSKNKQRASLTPGPTAGASRPRTGSQWLETAGGGGGPSLSHEGGEGGFEPQHRGSPTHSGKRRGSDASSPMSTVMAATATAADMVIKRQRSSGETDPSTALGRARAPSITVDLDDVEEAEETHVREVSRRPSRAGAFLAGPSRRGSGPASDAHGGGNCRSRRGSDSATSPLCARVASRQEEAEEEERAVPSPALLRATPGLGAAAQSERFVPAADLPDWVTDPDTCHTLKGSAHLCIALHVSAFEGAPDAAVETTSGDQHMGEAGATEPFASPLAISVRYVSTNLDDDLGQGSSLAGAVGLPAAAVFEARDTAAIAGALRALWPVLAPGGAGGAIDLGERSLRATGLPGAYAGLRVHAVLVASPSPSAGDGASPRAIDRPHGEDEETRQPHVTLLCRARMPEGAAPAERAPGSSALSILAECGDVIARLDTKMRVCYISPNCAELTGYLPFQLLGMDFGGESWLIHREDAHSLRRTTFEASPPTPPSTPLRLGKRPPSVRIRALARMVCRGASALNWVEMMMTHTYAPAPAGGAARDKAPQMPEAITVSMREKEWRVAGGGGGSAAGALADTR